MIAIVEYQVATYSGQIHVNCTPNDEDDYIIARAKKIVRQSSGGELPFGYQKWRIINREY